jgi:homoserine O-acetyltransferase
MSAVLTLSPGAELFLRPGPFQLEHDSPLAGLALPYERSGPRDGGAAPAIVVQGGISASAHFTATARDPTPGWWQDQVGPGRALDPDRFALLSLDFLGRRERALVSSADQARATALLLDELRIGRLHAFVGASYGGMVALKFAELFPDRVERVVAISAPDRPRVFATAWRALQRRVLELGRRGGAAAQSEAVALARAMGMLSYRCASEFEERFASAAPADCPAEEYLLARGRDFAVRFDAGALARLSRAIDLHRADVSRVRARTTLVAADPDLLVPPEQIEEMAGRFGGPARFVRLASRFGHDAFLKEREAIERVLESALEEAP